MTEGDELLTVDEVAERVKVNPETVRRWIKGGRLPARKAAGGPYRIHSTDLDRLFGVPQKGEAPTSPQPAEDEERRYQFDEELNDLDLEELGQLYSSLPPRDEVARNAVARAIARKGISEGWKEAELSAKVRKRREALLERTRESADSEAG